MRRDPTHRSLAYIVERIDQLTLTRVGDARFGGVLAVAFVGSEKIEARRECEYPVFSHLAPIVIADMRAALDARKRPQ